MLERAYVRAAAYWSARHPDLTQRRERRVAAAETPPAASLLSIRARGRASMLTRMFAEVVHQLARAGGADLRAIPMIFGSRFGEMHTTAKLLEMMHERDGALSPARFQVSVHNAAAGLISIACGNAGFSTCLAAGDATFATCLLEAFALLDTQGGAVLVVAGDEPPPQFLAGRFTYTSAAVGLHLATEPDASDLAGLSALRVEGSPDEGSSVIEPRQIVSASEPGEALLDALLAERRQTVSLGSQASSRWYVDVEPRTEGR